MSTTNDLVDLATIAEMLGVTVGSARTYNQRARVNRRNRTPKPGDLPAADTYLGGSPCWRRQTIEHWIATRPGRGAGGGRPRSASA